VNKKDLTETDIRTKFITPAILGPNGSKWNVMTQVLEERYFTKGRIIVRGKTVQRGEAKKADYILFYKPNIPIAVVEAKDNNHSVGAGMQQALDYAETLDVPFAYSSNGDGFVEHDRTGKAASPERDPIPDRDVFYVADPISSIRTRRVQETVQSRQDVARASTLRERSS
jgi:type I restriction enzyme R subunit